MLNKLFAGFAVICIVVLLALGLQGCGPLPEPDFTQIRSAVKELKAVDPMDGKLKAFCSGVVIQDGLILTAAHCDVKYDVLVNGYKAFVVKKDTARDLLLLYAPAGVYCPCVKSTTDVQRDEKVYAVGFPLDAGQTLTEGRWQHAARDAKGKEMDRKGEALYTAPVTFGNSGGGVFVYRERTWALAGIVTRGTIIPVGGFVPLFVGHLNYGADSASISAFLQEE